MSQSPTGSDGIAQARDHRSAYRQQLKHLDDLLNRGGSLSGNERNCAFLNLGPRGDATKQFATVSSVSGLDFADDGRCYALTDWDDDGDTDLWTANRTAPRVRFLQNTQRSGHHFVSFRLVGRSCNRDAIGAKVTLWLPNDGKPIARVVRAGQGFLSQSSKRLTIGLATATRIVSLNVQWPDGTRQTMHDLPVDRHYVIVQGEAAKSISDQPSRLPPMAGSTPLTPRSPTDQAAILLTSPVPLPQLTYRPLTNETDASVEFGSPVLLTLWATWCPPCLTELQSLSNRQHELRDQGVHVIALSVDQQMGSDAKTTGAKTIDAKRAPSNPRFDHRTVDLVRKIAASLDDSMTIGFATTRLLDRLQAVDDAVFSQKRPLAVPGSFLIDRSGRLAAIYRGAVSVDTLVEHVARLELSGRPRFDAALPFRGTWYQPRLQPLPIRLVAVVYSQGDLAGAANYLLQNRSALKGQSGFVPLASRIGSELARQNERDAAIAVYGAVLEQSPDELAVLNNLAWQLATHPDPDRQDADRAALLASRAARLSGYKSPTILDTLATALQAADRPDDARRVWRRALQQARRQQNTALEETLVEKLNRLSSAARR